jgi:hypothetical protein
MVPNTTNLLRYIKTSLNLRAYQYIFIAWSWKKCGCWNLTYSMMKTWFEWYRMVRCEPYWVLFHPFGSQMSHGYGLVCFAPLRCKTIIRNNGTFKIDKCVSFTNCMQFLEDHCSLNIFIHSLSSTFDALTSCVAFCCALVYFLLPFLLFSFLAQH